MVMNSGKLPHTFTIDGLVNVALAAGGMKTVSFQAAAGSYRVYCAEAGHTEAGMTGTLIVAAPGQPPPPTPTTTSTTDTATTTAGVAGATATLTPKATVASKAIVCAPRGVGAFVVYGIINRATKTSLVLTANKTTALGRMYRGKVVSVVLTSRTSFTGVNSALTAGLKPGGQAKVTVGRCAANQRLRVATKVVLLKAAASGSQTESGAGTTLDLKADPKGMPMFDLTKLEAPAGKVTLRMTNASPITHNIAIVGHGDGKIVGKGGVSTITAVLKPGTYKYFCAVPGHAAAGMVGVLTVK
jgi:plastocyanin